MDKTTKLSFYIFCLFNKLIHFKINEAFLFILQPKLLKLSEKSKNKKLHNFFFQFLNEFLKHDSIAICSNEHELSDDVLCLAEQKNKYLRPFNFGRCVTFVKSISIACLLFYYILFNFSFFLYARIESNRFSCIFVTFFLTAVSVQTIVNLFE
jgi:hypothetical protein